MRFLSAEKRRGAEVLEHSNAAGDHIRVSGCESLKTFIVYKASPFEGFFMKGHSKKHCAIGNIQRELQRLRQQRAPLPSTPAAIEDYENQLHGLFRRRAMRQTRRSIFTARWLLERERNEGRGNVSELNELVEELTVFHRLMSAALDPKKGFELSEHQMAACARIYKLEHRAKTDEARFQDCIELGHFCGALNSGKWQMPDSLADETQVWFEGSNAKGSKATLEFWCRVLDARPRLESAVSATTESPPVEEKELPIETAPQTLAEALWRDQCDYLRREAERGRAALERRQAEALALKTLHAERSAGTYADRATLAKRASKTKYIDQLELQLSDEIKFCQRRIHRLRQDAMHLPSTASIIEKLEKRIDAATKRRRENRRERSVRK